jgi:hypothetical protein
MHRKPANGIGASSPPEINAITGRALIMVDNGNFIFSINNYASPGGGLRASARRLLDALAFQLTKQSDYRGEGKKEPCASIAWTTIWSCAAYVHPKPWRTRPGAL